MRNKLITGIAALMLGAGVAGCATNKLTLLERFIADSYRGRSISQLKSDPNDTEPWQEVVMPEDGRVEVHNGRMPGTVYFLEDKNIVMIGGWDTYGFGDCLIPKLYSVQTSNGQGIPNFLYENTFHKVRDYIDNHPPQDK